MYEIKELVKDTFSERIVIFLSLAFLFVALQSCDQVTNNEEDDDNGNGNIVYHQSTINSNETWTSDKLHVIDGWLNIESATVTIEAGTVVEFTAGAYIQVRTGGGILADGSNGSIIFTGQTEQKGYWDFIKFEDDANSSQCQFLNCVFKYGGGKDANSAILIINGSNPSIQNSTVSHSGSHGILINDAADPELMDLSFAEITGNNIQNTHSGYLKKTMTWKADQVHLITSWLYIEEKTVTIEAGATIQLAQGAEMIVREGGGLIADGSTNAITFTGTTQQAGYWDYLEIEDDANFNDCKLINCVIEYGGGYSDEGAMLYVEGDPTITNSIIRHSASNGVLLDKGSEPQFSQNTITSNALSPIEGHFTNAGFIGSGTYTGNTNDFIYLNGGAYLQKDATWLKHDVPYRLNSWNYVENSSILTLSPGITAEMADGADITVRDGGGLVADGSTEQITITSSIQQNGYWDYIEFEDNASDVNSKLINCIVEYGGGYGDNSAAIIIENNARVKNSTIRYSGAHGVKIDDAAGPDFSGNIITGNDKSPVNGAFEIVGYIGDCTYTGNADDFILLDGGSYLKENATLLKQDVPYRVNSWNYVEDNATLTIEAGTHIEFGSGADITVRNGGGLIADGTSESITFTGAVKQKGFWDYIEFDSDAADANCKLINCVLEYGGGYGSNSAIVWLDSNDPTIEDNSIRYSSSYGLSYDDANGTRDYESNNTFTDNDAGAVRVR
ncbi:MAG: hypothetical protein GF313_07990 [Caldithrix sp.]|nr:hypothetical protein [Caldithrix sp.]